MNARQELEQVLVDVARLQGNFEEMRRKSEADIKRIDANLISLREIEEDAKDRLDRIDLTESMSRHPAGSNQRGR